MSIGLAQMLLSDPQEFTVPDFVSDALYSLFELWRLTQLGTEYEEASSSYLYGFPNDPNLILRPYDWGWDEEDGDMLPNIEFGGTRLWVYKYLGRGMTTDQPKDTGEWTDWVISMSEYVFKTYGKAGAYGE